MIGRSIAHYEITALIGEGGMGRVFRATDTKLKRDVALKILPESFAQDPHRMGRFQREAEVLASLNHPNIAGIHGIEHEGDTHAIAMELVPGETLAALISRGPIPLDETLEIARQIAEALEAAHEKGIIHRDLKPANVMITPEGQVKVLDFGLAKALVSESTAADLSNSPTLTAAATQMGVILGTAAYMSPEQARGKPVDKRTDIWAFGVVLFEMLMGRPAFPGETITDVLGAVVHKDPDWSILPPETPRLIRRLLARCLTKDVKHRLHDIADARLEIEEATRGSAAALEVPIGAATPPRRLAWRALPWALVAVSVSAALWTGRWSEPPAATEVTRMTITLPPGQAVTSSLAIISDGQTVAFTAAGASESPQLYIRRLDEFESQAVEGTEEADSPFFSPDSQSIAFFSKGRLFRWNLGGGDPQPLAEAPSPMGGTWGGDDTIVFVPVWNGGLYQVRASGGLSEAEPLIVPDGKQDYAFVFPRFVPDQPEVLFTAWGERPELWRLGLGRLDRSEVSLPENSGTVTTSGHLLFSPLRSPNSGPAELLAARYSSVLAPEQSPKGILSGVHTLATAPDLWLSVSRTGTLAYAPSDITQRSLVLVDQLGQTVPVSDQRRVYVNVAVSPDGGRIATDVDYRVWLYELDGGRVRLAVENRDWTTGELSPAWDPDGSRVLYSSNESGNWEIYARVPGTAESEVVLQKEYDQTVQAIAKDGTLVFLESDPKTGKDIWLLPPAGAAMPWLATVAEEIQPDFSPDGRWLAYSSNASGSFEVYVGPVSGGSERTQVTTEGGQGPVWSPNGNRLFYRQGATMMAVDVESLDPFKFGSHHHLFDGRWALRAPEEPFLRNYDVTPDGEHFVMIRHEPEAIPNRINIVLNWFEELKRLVPVK